MTSVDPVGTRGAARCAAPGSAPKLQGPQHPPIPSPGKKMPRPQPSRHGMSASSQFERRRLDP
eukprot:1530468-Alexandrium_andersonii.AAC.1